MSLCVTVLMNCSMLNLKFYFSSNTLSPSLCLHHSLYCCEVVVPIPNREKKVGGCHCRTMSYYVMICQGSEFQSTPVARTPCLLVCIAPVRPSQSHRVPVTPPNLVLVYSHSTLTHGGVRSALYMYPHTVVSAPLTHEHSVRSAHHTRPFGARASGLGLEA